MARKPTYAELVKRIRDLEKETIKLIQERNISTPIFYRHFMGGLWALFSSCFLIFAKKLETILHPNGRFK